MILFIIPLASAFATGIQKVALSAAAASYLWSAFSNDYQTQWAVRNAVGGAFGFSPPEPWDVPNGQSPTAIYDIEWEAIQYFRGAPGRTVGGRIRSVRGAISAQQTVVDGDQRLFFSTGSGEKTAIFSANAVANQVIWNFSSVRVTPQPGYEEEDAAAPRAPYSPNPLLEAGILAPELNPEGFLEFQEEVDFEVPGGGIETRTQTFEVGRPKVLPGGFKIPAKTRITHPDGRSGEVELGVRFDLTPTRSNPASGADRRAPGTIPTPNWAINVPSPAPFEIAPGVTVEVNLLPPGLRVDVERIPLPAVPRPLQPGLELEVGYGDDWGSPRPVSPDPCPDPCPPAAGGGGDCPDPCPEQKELKNEERLIGVQVFVGFESLPRNVIEIYEEGESLFVPRLGWVTFLYLDAGGIEWRSPPVDIKRTRSFVPVPNGVEVAWATYEVHTIEGVYLSGATPVSATRQGRFFEYLEV